MSWGIKLSFCMSLNSNRRNICFIHFKWVWSSTPGHTQIDAKYWVSVNSRTWGMKLVFGMWLEIRGSYKFIPLFQVAMVRHAFQMDAIRQSLGKLIQNNKSAISQMNWGINLISCLRLDIHRCLFDSVHSYGYDQARMDLAKAIFNFKSAVCRDRFELWCWFFPYG